MSRKRRWASIWRATIFLSIPLLYWPMDPREKNLSPAALSKIADYMRLGGTILFDTRDLTLGAVRGDNNPGQQTLRRLTAGLDLPRLEPVPADHVLTKVLLYPARFSRPLGRRPIVDRGAAARSQEWRKRVRRAAATAFRRC